MFKLIALLGLYAIISIPLFYLVFESSQEVIDEEFHIRQGMHYCLGNLEEWDPKITTLPGLYVVTSILHYPFGTCSTWNFRLTSLIGSFFNVWLIYKIRSVVLQNHFKNWRSSSVEFEALTLSLLPPMFFFAHLYYTDVLSLTTVLLLQLFNLKNQHSFAAAFGLLSVFMRQTNIVWVAMSFGTTVFDKLVSQTLPFIKGNETYGRAEHVYSFPDIWAVLYFYCKRFYLVPKQMKLLISHLLGYICVLIAFILFVIWNGSIVIGDKSAHEASLHIPQIYYFSAFVLVFGIGIWLNDFAGITHTLFNHRSLVISMFVFITMTVYLNTIEHPYLLADNRHYTFYIWNRFYGAFDAARYLVVPIYIVGLLVVHAALANKTAGFRLCYVICTICALAFQRLIEVRYFLVPFIVLRLHCGPISKRFVAAELVLYATINAFVFFMFSTKEIHWDDFAHIQRLIW